MPGAHYTAEETAEIIEAVVEERVAAWVARHPGRKIEPVLQHAKRDTD